MGTNEKGGAVETIKWKGLKTRVFHSVAARGRGRGWKELCPGCTPTDEVGQNEEERISLCRCLSLNSDALAVPRQQKNSGAATASIDFNSGPYNRSVLPCCL